MQDVLDFAESFFLLHLPSLPSFSEISSLRPRERVPEVPIVSREHLPQFEKIQKVLTSRRDEAHFRSGVSMLIHLTSGTSEGFFTPLL